MNTFVFLPGSHVARDLDPPLAEISVAGDGSPIRGRNFVVDVHRQTRLKSGGWRTVGWLTRL